MLQNLETLAREAYDAMRTGQTFRTEVQLMRKDGSVGWYRLDGELLYPGSDESIWAFFDVTERKAMLDELEGHRHHLEALVFNRTTELAAARDAAEAARVRRLAYDVAAAKWADLDAQAREGLVPVSDALDARAAMDLAQVSMVQSRYQERIAIATLELAMGLTLVPEQEPETKAEK